MKVQVLDCTLRDGGYYGNWDFDENTVRKYLASIAIAKVDIVEIGFRLLPQDRFLGALAYSTDDYLNTLPIPENIMISVMLNAKEFINYPDGPQKAINLLFNEKKNSPVDIVRVAVHANDVEKAYLITNELHALGYRVFLNIMQITSVSEDVILDISRTVKDWNTVEVLYFADSFGNMEPESVKETASCISTHWDGEIGIHTHDNKGQALINCIAALASGVTYLDSTLLGMGRGAGNVKTENLLVELSQRGYGEYYPDAVFPLVLHEFKQLQQQYGWGPNIYYFLSAVHGIHPTYIQEMLGDTRYGTEHILSAINFLKSTQAPFYSFENMLRAISGIDGNESGTWSAAGWAEGRDMLLIGAGPGSKRYMTAIKQFVTTNNPIVICLNINESVPEELVSAYIACHETRILIESDRYSGLKKPLIIPLSRVPDGIKSTLNGVKVFDYGLRIQEDSFHVTENGCVLSNPLAVAYAISLATASGVNKIYLAGMDGYEASDPRQNEMVDILNKYAELKDAVPLVAITPTTYPVRQRSVYEPEL